MIDVTGYVGATSGLHALIRDALGLERTVMGESERVSGEVGAGPMNKPAQAPQRTEEEAQTRVLALAVDVLLAAGEVAGMLVAVGLVYIVLAWLT